MSIDEKYLLSLQGSNKNRFYNWGYFLDCVSQFHPTSPENIFLFLYKRKYIQVSSTYKMNEIMDKLQSGLPAPLHYISFKVSKLGYEVILAHEEDKLLNKDNQLKLDI